MKKVFVLNVDSYNDIGHYLGTNVAGVYATRELAQEFIDNSREPGNEIESFEEYVANTTGVKDMSEEDKEIMYSNHLYTMSYPQDEYRIAEFELEGE
tara:strand:- start:3637 stop:3927 length:291 start_codon:yes stop_codon:yes gene_type:complete